MIRFILNMIARFFFGAHWSLPEFVVRPARLLYEKALVLSQVFVGRSGVGKTYAMGVRTIKGQEYVMTMAGFSEAYDPEKPWLERVEDQVDRVQRVFEALNEELIKRNPTMGGRPIKSLLANVLLLANA